VLTLGTVDEQTRADIALLQNSSFLPCSGSKCEMCLEGCQVTLHQPRDFQSPPQRPYYPFPFCRIGNSL
jgi:hypothetical protein